MITDIKKFTATFNKIAHSKSEDSVFTDFLDMVICALSLGQYEEEYLSIVRKYKREEVDLFCELLAELLIIMDNDGAGLKDCLGEFFQSHISRGKNGQFFTPESCTDLMAAMTISKGDTAKTFLDPCCGSGRILLSAAKVSRSNYFYGADIDIRCVKMTAINLCLNGLQGEVSHQNSLSGEHWGGYSIKCIQRAHLQVPVIRKLPANEGIIYNSAPFNRRQKQQEQSPPSQEIKVITATQAKLNFEE